MKHGIYAPNFGPFGNPSLLVEMARAAEQAGWDGMFIWDHLLWTYPKNDTTADPWVAVGAMAAATNRIRLGVLVTPLPRRRPWKVAREVATLDHLSGGRAVMGVGSGHDMFKEYSAFGEAPDKVLHGEMLDEGLEVITGLWSGEPFSYTGKHYQIKDAEFLPPPLQQPRVPVWVAGMWPNKKPFRRAARWDGVFPIGTTAALSPEDLREIKSYIMEHRTSSAPFDILTGGKLLAGDPEAQEKATHYEEAGTTWWLSSFDALLNAPTEEILDAVRRGPNGD